MANAKKYPNSIKAVAMRLTRLNDCGIAIADTVASSRLTTKSFVMVEFEPEYEDGSEITVKNGDGDVEVYKRGEPRLKGLVGTMKMVGVPIHAMEMTIGASLLTDDESTPEVRGAVLPSRTTDSQLTQLELWSRVGGEGNCAGSAAGHPYYKWTVPLASSWKLAGSLVAGEEDPTEFELEFFAEQNAGYTESISGELPSGVTEALVGSGPLSWVTVDSLPTVEDSSTYDTAAA